MLGGERQLEKQIIVNNMESIHEDEMFAQMVTSHRTIFLISFYIKSTFSYSMHLLVAQSYLSIVILCVSG